WDNFSYLDLSPSVRQFFLELSTMGYSLAYLSGKLI
ncbi:unnamed protein product, partial [marine sediment metagenome]